jgi:hypothetical protein
MTLDDHRHPCSERAPVACGRNHGPASYLTRSLWYRGARGAVFRTLFARYARATEPPTGAGVRCNGMARSGQLSGPGNCYGARAIPLARQNRLNRQIGLSKKCHFPRLFRRFSPCLFASFPLRAQIWRERDLDEGIAAGWASEHCRQAAGNQTDRTGPGNSDQRQHVNDGGTTHPPEAEQRRGLDQSAVTGLTSIVAFVRDDEDDKRATKELLGAN